MKKILKPLFDGEYVPMEHIRPQDKLYSTKSRLETKVEASLREKLPEQFKEDFEKVILAKEELAMLEVDAAYLEGFRLGVRMMTEVFQNDAPDS